MRWVAIVLGVLFAVLVGVYTVGSMQRMNFTVIRSVTLHQPPEAVWAALTDPSRESAWRTDLVSVTRLSDREGHPVWEEKYRNGDVLRFETTIQEPMTRFRRKLVDKSAFGRTYTFDFIPAADGKSVTVKLQQDGIIYEPVSRFIGAYITGHEVYAERYLKDLAAKFGEKAEWPKQ